MNSAAFGLGVLVGFGGVYLVARLNRERLRALIVTKVDAAATAELNRARTSGDATALGVGAVEAIVGGGNLTTFVHNGVAVPVADAVVQGFGI